MLSDLGTDLTVSLSPAVEARETLEADGAGGEVMTGETFTRDAIGRPDYHTQRCLTTPNSVQEFKFILITPTLRKNTPAQVHGLPLQPRAQEVLALVEQRSII